MPEGGLAPRGRSAWGACLADFRVWPSLHIVQGGAGDRVGGSGLAELSEGASSHSGRGLDCRKTVAWEAGLAAGGRLDMSISSCLHAYRMGYP